MMQHTIFSVMTTSQLSYRGSLTPLLAALTSSNCLILDAQKLYEDLSYFEI